MKWLKNEVLEGLKTLMALKMPNAPAQSAIADTAKVWINVFTRQPEEWNESLDKWRVSEAFLSGASQLEQWPTPIQILKLMPRRKTEQAPQNITPNLNKDKPMPIEIQALWRIRLGMPLTEKQADIHAKWVEQQEKSGIPIDKNFLIPTHSKSEYAPLTEKQIEARKQELLNQARSLDYKPSDTLLEEPN